LAIFLCAAAILEHESGRETECLRNLQRLYTEAQIVDHGGRMQSNMGNMADFMEATDIRAWLFRAIEQVDPDLRLQVADGSRDAARKLLQSLLDPDIQDSASRHFDRELAITPDELAKEAALDGWWIRPLRDDEVARTLETLAVHIDGFRERDWTAMQKYFPARLSATNSNLNDLIYWHSSGTAGYGMEIPEFAFKDRANVAAAAVLLASRLYALDKGRLPRSLGELSPDYLKAIPVDPYSPTGAPIHCRVDADGLTVWSVGPNTTDEGGQVRFDSKGQKFDRYSYPPYGQRDIIFGSAWRNAKMPAGTAASGPVGP
jgi:hypothetical protein